ncbi:hypothetical protein [Falsiroseomonas sp. CW058]|uniref:hypothetical protein n=1 Tax=Falsiroseomonas sp. CW058 TaxID=3388664 RepID=UPI003D320834
MPTRRQLMRLSALLPLGACAGGGREEPATLAPLVTGYRYLTPIRLNIAEVEVADPAPGAVRVSEPAPVRPEAEMRRMAEERLVPMGTEGTARFTIAAAQFGRERLAPQGGLGGFFGGEPGERLTCRLLCRLEILSAEGRRTGFVEAEARRSRTLPDGTSPAARTRAAEEVVRQAMEELNVEFEFQIRRTLRAWLVEGAAAPPAPAAPDGGEAIEREDLPRG